eukprot:CAMPEP_0198265042 /NCGR_PEP_ID=MMETSP1447-20131203/19818_1 /TAXON_ID=420782 /ORGANISM="Chaetoceros dichaeta, Strain CCMP1751" /LENGTH=74 /DNA_ID=CAMNT_0043954279 /DNA_START=511 /DNA_END=735 /DNA_ORIENTATION=+
MVVDGVVTVLHPRLPMDVAAFAVGVLSAYSMPFESAGFKVREPSESNDENEDRTSRRFLGVTAAEFSVGHLADK